MSAQEQHAKWSSIWKRWTFDQCLNARIRLIYCSMESFTFLKSKIGCMMSDFLHTSPVKSLSIATWGSSYKNLLQLRNIQSILVTKSHEIPKCSHRFQIKKNLACSTLIDSYCITDCDSRKNHLRTVCREVIIKKCSLRIEAHLHSFTTDF